MPATLARPRKPAPPAVVRVFRRGPAGYGETHTLAYRVRGGQHVVTHWTPGGEFPDEYRLETVGEARETWRGLQRRILGAGFVRV